ncbi:DUF4230 domain-containing protein [Hathewaya histolytica]|uniref:DUF4230 domain-containing protein n=1 Tax=Hathewaya histolytica TaxID=1498 RepID=UPI003B67A418
MILDTDKTGNIECKDIEKKRSFRERLKKRPKLNLTITILCITILAVITFITGMKFNKVSKINTSTIAERVDKISEISTLKYNYSSVVALKDNLKLKDLPVPFTGKSFIVKYNGYIKFGTDLKSKTIKLSDNKKKVSITLPKCKVLDNVADTKNLMVYDEKYSIFNRYGAQDMINEIAKEQKRIENQIIKDGYIEKANEEVKTLMQGMLSDMGFEEISIVFN